MGTAPATKIAANNYSLKPAKLMLEAPFASAEVMLQDASGLALPGATATNLQINNGEEIKKIQQPFFWIHGISDDFLNIETHGEIVYANYQGTYKEAHRIQNAGHSNIENTMGFQKYLNQVGTFIRK
jgi:pimeloyl-ACP methyl ester carboxylesterase